MTIKRYDNYKEAEVDLLKRIIWTPDFVTKHTNEVLGAGFILSDPQNNENGRSNYKYAEEFFNWLISGEMELSEAIMRMNPWVKRFVDTAGLPPNFSASYGPKIKGQINTIMDELLKNEESRRAYLSILYPTDQVILQLDHTGVKSTHEFPCTIGLHFMIREGRLQLIANMRSNNCYRVLPYDVYNFTCLQKYIANQIDIEMGAYLHQMNSAHLFSGDVRRLKTELVSIS